MEVQDLVRLGFNKNEAKVYLSLIGFGRADAHQIISDTKFHKNIVYDNLSKLIDKGLVSFVVDGRKRLFQIASSNALVDFFEDKEKRLAEKKKLAKEMTKKIGEISKKLPSKQEATIYRGVNGIKSFYNLTLNVGGDYVVFGAPQKSVDLMGETFWRNYNLKRVSKKISVRMIFNPSIEEYGETVKDRFTKVKYFDYDFEPLTETHIQRDLVAIIVWTEEPVLFLIKDQHVAKSYLYYFEQMWRKAKP